MYVYVFVSPYGGWSCCSTWPPVRKESYTYISYSALLCERNRIICTHYMQVPKAFMYLTHVYEYMHVYVHTHAIHIRIFSHCANSTDTRRDLSVLCAWSPRISSALVTLHPIRDTRARARVRRAHVHVQNVYSTFRTVQQNHTNRRHVHMHTHAKKMCGTFASFDLFFSLCDSRQLISLVGARALAYIADGGGAGGGGGVVGV